MTRSHPRHSLGSRARLRRGAAFAVLVGVVTSSVAATTLVSAAVAHARRGAAGGWTMKERELLRSLSLASLAPLAPDPSNRYGDDARAAELGRALFFDTRLSG